MKNSNLKKEIEIGGVKLPHRFFMAPLAGFTDAAFRLIASENGAALTYSEMVSAKGMSYGDRGSKELLAIAEGEGPTAVQLFGHEEYFMRRGVQLLPPGHSLIDINMGCPVPKVVKNGEGSALLNDRFTAAAVVRATVKAEEELAEREERLPRPVTVKCRIGFDEAARDTVLDFAPMMEEAGASAVCVHGRTREQYYAGEADWEMIARARERVSVPLIGSGDLFTAENGVGRILDGYCDAVMYARGALGNPWIFRESLLLWDKRCTEDSAIQEPDDSRMREKKLSREEAETGNILQTGLPKIIREDPDKTDPGHPTEEERKETMLRHLNLVIQYKGEHRAVLEMRKLWGCYMKGIPGAVEIRRRINSMNTAAELRALLETLPER